MPTTVFLDIEVDATPAGRIVIELSDETPKTSENFRSLCCGETGVSYQAAPFHRIIPGFMMQGGDVTHGDGTGGKSIYNGKAFADENFKLKHSGPGIVSMANVGPNSNKSQFFITLAEAKWLDGKNVAFGKVIDGLELVRFLETFGSKDGKVSTDCRVSSCGQL